MFSMTGYVYCSVPFRSLLITLGGSLTLWVVRKRAEQEGSRKKGGRKCQGVISHNFAAHRTSEKKNESVGYFKTAL